VVAVLVSLLAPELASSSNVAREGDHAVATMRHTGSSAALRDVLSWGLIVARRLV
jgi:hypothetical protein